jgi:cytoskeletal protein CcmA (bactofilin family)
MTGAIGTTPAIQQTPTTGKIEAFLGKGSKVVGTLTFTGPVELDGYIEGEVTAQDRLTIGESAVINGRINGAEVMVKGTVTGDIVASKRLSLKKPAKIVGNITSSNLSIEEGVIFEGKCSMGAGSGDSKQQNKGPQSSSQQDK